MVRASEGRSDETLRLYRPGPVVVFGRRDAVIPEFAGAVRAARDRGFGSVIRLAGGRAAVFHEQTIAFAWTVPAGDPTSRTIARFKETSEILSAALRRLGVDARVGEVAGEYCPGSYSVNARGKAKLAGIGQRMIVHAAHIGGVVVAGGSERVRDVLIPVYSAMGLDWDPATAGSVAEEVKASWEDVFAAITGEFASRFRLEEGSIDHETLELAESLEHDHRAPVSIRR